MENLHEVSLFNLFIGLLANTKKAQINNSHINFSIKK